MIYQKLLMGSKPYFISVSGGPAFELHRHQEIELCYCLQGTYNIICEKKRYSLNEGDFAIIPPMSAHEIPSSNTSCKVITIEVGYTLLSEFFDILAERSMTAPVYKKEKLKQTAAYGQLVALLEETASLHRSGSAFCDLAIMGNLHKISYLLLQIPNSAQTNSVQAKKPKDIEVIDKALKSIYNSYYKPLNVETISDSCGYSKSNFCKLFKNATGDTFHHTLNRHRIEVACILLRESNDSIEKIAQETGFADSKSFCRVFKGFMGKNAGTYRKSFKAE